MNNLNFTVSAAFDRGIFWKGGQSVRYLVARLKADRTDEHRPAERTPLNIALVIDASGSMAGDKLEAAKKAALGLAERLSRRDRLTVVSFASDVVVHLDAVPATAENAVRIRSEVSGLETRGMTCLSGGWFAGVECTARIAEKDPRLTARVIILSDGHANEGITDPEELREHAGELRLRGVLTSTLGIGDGYDEHLLRGIAENGGGRLHDAELAAEISTVLLGELDDILGTLVENAQIVLSAPASVRAEPIGLASAEAPGHHTTVTMGPVQNGVERLAVFKVTCPEAHRDDRLTFEIVAHGRAVDDGSALAADTGPLVLAAAGSGANSAQDRSEELAQIVARTWSAHIVSRAARMNRDGAFRDAERYVKRELKHFTRYVEGLESGYEMIGNLKMLAERVVHVFTPRLRKEMVLESALMTESRVDRRGVPKASWRMRMARGE